MVKKERIIEWIIVSTFLLFLILTTIQLILKFTGHSPTETQLLFSSLIIIIIYLFGLTYKIGLFFGETKGFMKETRRFIKETKYFMKDTRDFMRETRDFMKDTERKLTEIKATKI